MILTALNNYYDRLVARGDSQIAPYGFSQEKISYALVLNSEGELLQVKSLMDTSGKKPVPSIRQVPQPSKRSVNIDPCFLWDKSSYVLGLTNSEESKVIERAKLTHEAFKSYHQQWLSGSDDEGLCALLAFLAAWDAEDPIQREKIPESALDANLVFQLDGEQRFLHERPAAIAIRQRQVEGGTGQEVACLVTGEMAKAAVLHPAIKGVNGAQSSGASMVSFNLDAFTSYGKEQGANAPVSEKAAFAYTTVLNHFLRRDDANRHRLQIGDTTVVLWAETDNAGQADAGEFLLSILMNPPTDQQESQRLHSVLSQVAKGRPLRELDANLEDTTKIYVLGLAPNASRLSIRFWETASLDEFARRLAEHFQDLVLDPLPWKQEPAIWRLLSETVPHREGSKPKLDDVPPQLAGELARAILTGSRYPRSLLANLIMRMRVDGDISPLRVALCKAILTRDARLSNRQNQDKEIPVSLDTENADSGYVLGRLFALLEYSQSAALGSGVNATIGDRYYGAASATPASVFPVLLRNLKHHLGKIRKDKPGLAVKLERQIGEVIDLLTVGMPKSLRIEAQGRFAIGYYHQNRNLFRKSDTTDKEGDEQ